MDEGAVGELVIVEVNYAGHRMYYCQLLAQAWPGSATRVTLATSSNSIVSEEFDLRFPATIARPKLKDLGSLLTTVGPRYQMQLARTVLEVRALDGVERVVVPEGDKLTIWLALLPATNLTGIALLVMRAPRIEAAHPLVVVREVVKAIGMRLVKWRGGEVFVLSPATPARNEYVFCGWKAAPDPVNTASTESSVRRYRELIALDGDRTWIGVFGNVTRRKNLDLIVQALIKAGSAKYGLLVAGKIPPTELIRCRPFLDSFVERGGEVRFDSRLLDDEELDSAIASVWATAIAHSSEGPSGILGKAVASGTYVFAAGAKSLRDDVRRLGGGTWTPLEVNAMADVIALKMPSHRQMPVSLADGREFARVLLGLKGVSCDD